VIKNSFFLLFCIIFSLISSLSYSDSRKELIDRTLTNVEAKQVLEEQIVFENTTIKKRPSHSDSTLPSSQGASWKETFKDWLLLTQDGYAEATLKIGYMTGNTAYDFNHHVSELEYPMDNWMIGGSLEGGLNNSKFSFGLSFWTNIDKNAGNDMKDKDWDQTGSAFSQGTLYSYTESQADLRAIMFDIYGRYNFYEKAASEEKVKLGVLLGYKRMDFEYDMYDLYYVTDLLYGYTGQTLYKDQKVLGYKITYHLPYLGLAFNFERKKWGIGADARWSFYPTAYDEDNHVLRNLTFYGDYDDGTAYMGNLYGFWNFSPSLRLKLGLEAAFIRLSGRTWESNHDPAWDADQATDARSLIGWAGISYLF
jgi:outer membrane protease